MYRTLLVDDDFLVRSYLKILDSWERAGYEIVKDVQDGEEALRVMEKEQIDVVITDISMPLMDGIELIRSIREEKEDVYIIVLSCHDDFEYVKEAMRLGADEYVLKNTLDEKTLYDILIKSGHQIRKRKEEKSEKEQVRKLIRMGSHTLKYHFFNGILSGTLGSEEREKKRKEAGIRGTYGNSAVINMFMQEWVLEREQMTSLEAEQYSQSFRHRLMAKMDEAFPDDSDFAEVIYLGAGVFCCFLDMSFMRRSSVMLQRLTNTASLCYQFCRMEPYSYGIGVSNICIGEDGIRQAYQQAREMMKLSFYDDGDILYYDYEKKVSTSIPKAARELYEDMENIIKAQEKEKLEKGWEQVLEAARKNCTESKVLLQWLRSLDERAGIMRSTGFYEKIRKIAQMEEVARKYSETLFAEKERDVPKGTSGTVRHALEFIHRNFKKQIGLQDVADAAGVNPAYLSYLFKQEMSVGFSSYLQDCRIAYARELLDTTNDKVKVVAQKAGFQDYHYFSKTFKKLNGMSPADYRRRNGE